MKTKPIFSLLVSMSVPMMLSMLIQSLYNIVDSIYVSRLGTDALTAVSLAYPLQNAIVSVAVGVGIGITSAISIHLGSGEQEKADRRDARPDRGRQLRDPGGPRHPDPLRVGLDHRDGTRRRS